MTSRGSEILHFLLARLCRLGLSILIAVPFLPATFPTALAFGIQQSGRSTGSWLDRPIAGWNAGATESPLPGLLVSSADVRTRCPDLIREPDRPGERELVRAGWLLYGPVQSYGLTKVVTALSSADNMCRPLGYQAFVFWDSIYAGTLSPTTMDSRTDGALTHFHLLSATRISGEFSRYRDIDEACCPGRISYVNYEVGGPNVQVVFPVEITTLPLSSTDAKQPVTNLPEDTSQLFEKKWRLIELGNVPVKEGNPYILFERGTNKFTANGGCNVFAGRFGIEGKQLNLSIVMSTRVACLDENDQKLETDFLAALERTTRFQLEDQVLRLYDWNSPVLAFKIDSIPGSSPEEPQLTLTVSFPPGTTLSENAVLEIQVVDITRANPLPETIAEQVINLAGREFPLVVTLKYDPGRVDESHKYVIQARVMEEGRRRLVNRRFNPVITMGNPKTANVTMTAVRR